MKDFFDKTHNKKGARKSFFSKKQAGTSRGKDFGKASKNSFDDNKDFASGSKGFARGSKDFSRASKSFAMGNKDFASGSKGFASGNKDSVSGNKDFTSGGKDFDGGSKSFNKGNKSFIKGSKDFGEGSKNFDGGSEGFAKKGKNFARASKRGSKRNFEEAARSEKSHNKGNFGQTASSAKKGSKSNFGRDLGKGKSNFGRGLNKNSDNFEEAYNGAKSYSNTSFSHGLEKNFDAKIVSVTPLFGGGLDEGAQSVLENFDEVLKSVYKVPLTHLKHLPFDVKTLSALLTSERAERRVGYMNDKRFLTSYLYYFMWWGLVRLTALFASLGEALKLSDGDICADAGSGPLVAVVALWLAVPRLRKLRLTFYCIDKSSQALSVGEKLFFAICQKTQKSATPWKIIRVKGDIAKVVIPKANLLIASNIFNEALDAPFAKSESNNQAFHAVRALMAFAATNAQLLMVEPSGPQSSAFVTSARKVLLESGYKVLSPCTHFNNCPMAGINAKYGGAVKWCNFSQKTPFIPSLQKLSESAGLNKARLSVTYLFATSGDLKKSEECAVRVTSERLALPFGEWGFYACSNFGLLLLISEDKRLTSGARVVLKGTFDAKKLSELPKDKKTGAIIIRA